MKVLVADNEKQTLDLLRELLSKEGFEVILAETGQQALDLYHAESPDFMCLDIMMPDLTGHDVCREVRKNDETIPIIFISAKAEVIDKIIGLEIGADDYIVKPFDLHEVIVRIRTVARRCISQKPQEKNDDNFMMCDLEVLPRKLKAMRGDNIIDLSLRDINILKLLHERKNEIVDRDTLLDHCWGAHIMPESRTLDWHISQLRKRIELDPKAPKIIRTVHGVGYKFEEET